jgi:hypothetical protein
MNADLRFAMLPKNIRTSPHPGVHAKPRPDEHGAGLSDSPAITHFYSLLASLTTLQDFLLCKRCLFYFCPHCLRNSEPVTALFRVLKILQTDLSRSTATLGSEDVSVQMLIPFRCRLTLDAPLRLPTYWSVGLKLQSRTCIVECYTF